ncbi:hypothetical protein OAO42_00745 [Candidatus Izimaplasma bacterium]|nr:hypothetical protein [Candidatus Izimaplasma bacterium]
MKHISLLFLTFILGIIMVGCEKEETELEITNDTIISMENLDDYMYRDDVQYVDLRNFESKFISGYIDSFENIPFFDFLDYRIVERDNNYKFESSELVNEVVIRNLFKEDKHIFLYADGCIRSEYIKEVLEYLGYSSVFVLGGFFDYVGDYKVPGVGEYHFGNTFYDNYIDPVTLETYHISGEFDLSHAILDLHINITDQDGNSIRLGTVNDQLNILEEYILSNSYNFEQIVSFINDESSEFYEIEGYTLLYSDSLLLLLEKLIRN